MLNRLSLRWKILVPLGMIAAILLLLTAVVISSFGQVSEATTRISDRYLPSVDYLVEADRDLYQSLVAERSLLFAEPGSDRFNSLKKQHEENMQQAHQRVEKFAALNPQPEIRSKVDRYNELRVRWEQLSKQVASKLSQGQEQQQAGIELSFGEADQTFGSMRDILDELTETTLANADAAREEVADTVDTSVLTSSAAALVALGICIALAIILPLLILGPLGRLNQHMRDIADGEGDLTVRLENNREDELGDLAANFNRFLEQMHQLISGVVRSTRELNEAAGHMNQVAVDSQHNVDKQLHEIEQVATAMEEMTATVQEVSHNAATAFAGANDADKAAGEGREVVSQTIDSIHDLAAEVDNAGKVINELKEESSNIGSVLNVIQGIAEQTNLLALNAAIEAARAGEQGRGFAVVADEVRTLASRTQESTQEIQKMIEALQSRAAKAVDVMSQGQRKAENSVERAGSAGTSLQSITEVIARINDMNAQIASAAEEQSSVAEDISRNTVTIRDLADRTADSGRQTSSAAEQMSRLSDALQQQVSRFRI